VISLAILAVVLVYAAVCTMTGFGPVTERLDSFQPDTGPLERHFHASPAEALAAFRSSVESTPGMRCVEERASQLLIDLRPTSRVLGGDYGQVIRVTVAADPAGAAVVLDSRPKVRFGFGNHEAALSHAERALRMQAKRFGLHEALDGISTASGAARPAAAAITTVPAGWYPDPASAVHIRRWDGARWTDHRAPRPPTSDRS
jgi:hypothetical protein